MEQTRVPWNRTRVARSRGGERYPLNHRSCEKIGRAIRQAKKKQGGGWGRSETEAFRNQNAYSNESFRSRAGSSRVAVCSQAEILTLRFASISSSSSSVAMAFTCPIDESNDRSGGADLQCHLCQSRLHSYRSLIEHFNRRHGVARSLMSKTYVYKKARRTKKNTTNTRKTKLPCCVDD